MWVAKAKKGSFRRAVTVGLGAFFLATIVSLASQGLVERVASILLAVSLLLTVILLGVVFDIIGVASAAAQEAPFHAQAAKKIPGASQARLIVRKADQVSSFCNDVVGDIAGTVSGALGALIVVRITRDYQGWQDNFWPGILMTATISALTIGGKAYCKRFAIEESTRIIALVGKALYWIEQFTGVRVLRDDRSLRRPKERKGLEDDRQGK